MKIGIELLADSRDRLDAHASENIIYLLINQCDAVEELLKLGISRSLEPVGGVVSPPGALTTIENARSSK